MATVTATEAAAGAPVHHAHGAGPVTAITTYSLPATGDGTAVDDIIEMVKVPKGAIILDVTLVTEDLDDDATPTLTLDVGDGGDDDRYLAADTVGQAGGVARTDTAIGIGHEYTADDTIDVHIDTVAATKQAGDITLVVVYTTNVA